MPQAMIDTVYWSVNILLCVAMLIIALATTTWSLLALAIPALLLPIWTLTAERAVEWTG